MVFFTAGDAVWFLRTGLIHDFEPATNAHVYLLVNGQRRLAVKGSLAQLVPVIARELTAYSAFRVVYRPQHAYGYIVRVECLNEQRVRRFEAKRRLRADETDLLAIILPTLPAAVPVSAKTQ